MPEQAGTGALRHPAGSVCIVLLTGLGDVVMGLALANALKDHDPGRRITWVAEPMPAGILRNHPSVDEVVVYRKKEGLKGIRRLRRDLAARRFDLTLNLNVYFKSIWPTMLSRAPVRVGFGRDRTRDGVWLFSNRHLPARPRRHTLDMFREFGDYLGLPAWEPEWRFRLTAEEREEQAEFFAPLRGRPAVGIVPASGNAKKDWLPERYAELIDVLELELGFRAVLVGGPGARESAMAREIMRRSRVEPVWALGDGVRRLLWLIGGSELVIAPDTGPVHIARALEVPVIGLYGHTNPWRVGPYRRYEDLWVDRYTPAGEEPDPGRFDPEVGKMEEITVADVLDRVALARERYGVAAG